MDIQKIITEIVLEEKVSLCSGQSAWETKAIERLGISGDGNVPAGKIRAAGLPYR
ncbi:MAG: hypothetical protein FWC16_01310 [Defluviitaleaceae bacterium]|nr:hypothetical protein [Defluviitaleaceae bacterium]MCL2273542.1 hypothetical protein [Defluviitaleaceae bacterium]